MLGLPKSTELSKQLPKKAIYEKFKINTSDKEKIDRDISRIIIVNEVSPSKISLSAGDKIKSFFVMSVFLKRKDFSEKTIITLFKMIPQNIIIVLQYEIEAKLIVYHSKLIQTQWQPLNQLNIKLQGLDFDKVWENIIKEIGNIKMEPGNTLEEQIRCNEQVDKIKKEIAKLEKQARTEKQPKKKFDLVKKINALKAEI